MVVWNDEAVKIKIKRVEMLEIIVLTLVVFFRVGRYGVVPKFTNICKQKKLVGNGVIGPPDERL